MFGKKILVNLITLEHGNVIPILHKIKKWQAMGHRITIFANIYLKKRIDSLAILDSYSFIELKYAGKVKGKIQFIFEAARRNFIALFYLKKLKREKFDAVYSISSVVDLIIFPWIFKKISKKTKWLTVFDNIVPLDDPGNKLIRFLGWFFFKISLFFLKKVDYIFTVSEELKNFLEKEGFHTEKIMVNGNAVETDLIKKARKNEKYNFDAFFIGRINETKGIYDMLNILSEIKKTYPEFKLGIAGEGDRATKDKFTRKIREMKLENNVEFLGYVSGQKKFDMIKSSKCLWFLSFSKHESFGISLLEAVCSGIPAFCYDLNPLKNLYKNGEVIMSPKRNWQAVSEKVLELFESNNFENKNGELLLDKYSWDRIAETEAGCF